MQNKDLCCYGGYIFAENPALYIPHRNGFPVNMFMETIKEFDYATIIEDRLVIFNGYSIVEEVPLDNVINKFLHLIKY